MELWNDIATLQRLGRIVPYVFIAFGFLVALSGQFVRSAVDSRISELKANALAVLKRTAPKLNGYLAWSVPGEAIMVVLDAENLIPFRARWTIVTDGDVLVSGIMLENYEIYPAEDRKRFTAKADIDDAKVVNEYVKLQLDYESLYAAEVGPGDELRGSITREYRYRDGGVFDWDDRVGGGRTESGQAESVSNVSGIETVKPERTE